MRTEEEIRAELKDWRELEKNGSRLALFATYLFEWVLNDKEG